jgi:type II secretory pathway pseudopilin PulG
MRRVQQGFTLIELLTVGFFVLVIVAMLFAFFGNWIVNRPGQTEARAYQAAQRFVATNKIEASRLTCAYDNDGDGYGSCTLVTTDAPGKPSEKIFLQCPARFLNTLMGADNCKEVDTTIQLSNKRR